MGFRTTLIALLPALCSAVPAVSSLMRRSDHHELSRRQVGINVMCWWESPSSAIIRDRVFVNGGSLKLANITAPGDTPQLDADDEAPFSYYLNLGNGFNVTDVKFETIDIGFSPVTDGFMAANDNSFWLYGGAIPDSDRYLRFPGPNEIQAYDVYRQGAERDWKQSWQIGATLPPDVNRYVTGGAGVNVRDLNQTYYFSGARNKNWGEIRGGLGVREQYRANVTSSQLIRGDLTSQRNPGWKNITLPKHVRPRVNAELVYVPVGNLGTLIVVGGVKNADWMTNGDDLNDPDHQDRVDDAIKTGPSFLRTVEVYDIASETWYLQNTTGDIPTTGLAKHCTVVASAKDGSSHQIYVYGGYPGQSNTLPMQSYDDVWVLSVPAFEWVKVYTGTRDFARKGHKCVKPLPDQMMVIGGRGQAISSCIDIARVFNLNKLEFMPSYDPNVYEDYKVPEVIRKVIGGDEMGGATKTVSKWANPTLKSIFSNRPPEKAATWYPYSPSQTNDPLSNITLIETKSEVPKFVYPVVAVCVVLLLAIVGGCIFFFYIRKKKLAAAAKENGHAQFQGEDKNVKYDTYPQYPSPHTSPYGTANSMTTLGVTSAYGHSRQYSVDNYSIEHSGHTVHELPAERNPVELDVPEMAKLSAVLENGMHDGAFSIVPTPATEASDPIGSLRPQPSTRTGRRSVFSEEPTTPTDDGIVSPLSPDPEIPVASLNATVEQGVANNNNNTTWWRKMSSKGSRGARRFSSFSSSRSNSRSERPRTPIN